MLIKFDGGAYRNSGLFSIVVGPNVCYYIYDRLFVHIFGLILVVYDILYA